ncbi:MAG: M56 family metallopeptidase, partial [Paludibacter sp.]
MTSSAIDFIKINIALMLFYFSYKAFFVQDTFLKTKRVYLKFSFLFSLYLPLINFTHWFEGKQITQTLMANNILLPDLYVVAPKSSFSWDVETVFLMLYFAVCAVFLIRFFIQLFAIIQMRRKGKVTILFNTKVIVLHDEIAPFSFLNWIFVNPELHTERELKEILTHELAHVKQVHSGDVFLSELLIMCFWINPVAWLLRREIRQNLEFLADNKVLESGFDSKSYQYHLLQLSYQSPDFKLSNKFNVSPLKKRIT